jgi:hypothetical protein
VKKHPPKTETVKLRMTVAERKMLRSLAIRHRTGSDSGFIRALIREAWERKTMRELATEQAKE